MSRPLRSAPVTGASPLLRAGPPANSASVLCASRFLSPSALPLAACCPKKNSQQAPLSEPAFPRSVQKPQNRLAPPSCRAPPGQ